MSPYVQRSGEWCAVWYAVNGVCESTFAAQCPAFHFFFFLNMASILENLSGNAYRTTEEAAQQWHESLLGQVKQWHIAATCHTATAQDECLGLISYFLWSSFLPSLLLLLSPLIRNRTFSVRALQ